METADISLNLDIADIVKMKPSKYRMKIMWKLYLYSCLYSARRALEKVLKIAGDEIDRQSSFLAIQVNI